MPPDEVLFRRLNAPVRYMENDIYFANEDLPANNPLPDSDTLKALHAYTSDFYSYATTNHGRTDWRSMDGTALIALGILLEETAKESLGETGDMVFVEGEEASDIGSVSAGYLSPGVKSRKRSASASSSGVASKKGKNKKSASFTAINTADSSGDADYTDAVSS